MIIIYMALSTEELRPFGNTILGDAHVLQFIYFYHTSQTCISQESLSFLLITTYTRETFYSGTRRIVRAGSERGE